MDTHTGSSSGSKPEDPIATCVSMLVSRQFSACRNFANSLPSSDTVARVQAIAHILSAPDFYTVLKLRRDDARDRDLVRRNMTKVALLLDPTRADKLPSSDEALARAFEARRVLSDPERRGLYDRDLKRRDQKASFWTACPYCWAMSEYEKMYEECTLRCQNCQSAFHGVAVTPPVKEGEDLGRGLCYWSHAGIPCKFSESNRKEKEMEAEKTSVDEEKTPVVCISSDDEGLGTKVEEGVKGDVDSEGLEKVQVQGSENAERKGRKPRMRTKTVGKKAFVWHRRRNNSCVDTDGGNDRGFD